MLLNCHVNIIISYFKGSIKQICALSTNTKDYMKTIDWFVNQRTRTMLAGKIRKAAMQIVV